MKLDRMATPLLMVPAVTALLTTAACQPDTTTSTDPFAAAPWTLSERETTIGSVDDPDYIFNPVLRMTLGPDGLLHTLHEGEATIRRWTADGAPAGTLGRKGEGPGEFQYPYQLGFFGDSLWVWDHLASRVSYFDTVGTFVGSVSVRAARADGEEPVAQPVAPLRDGTFMGLVIAGRHSIAGGKQTERPYVRMDAAGSRLARIWAEPLEPHDAISQLFGDTHLSGFGKGGLLVVDRRAWTGVGDATVRVTEMGFDGDTIFSVTVPYDPVPLAAERYDSVVRAWVGAGGGEAEIREALYRPSHLPAVSHLVVGEDGTIWLQRFDPVVVESGEPMREWWVLDSGGSPLARALTPEGLEVKLVTGDTVWGIERDELDVEYIVRHRLIKGG